jgi:uncharacterized protein (DUF362 family)
MSMKRLWLIGAGLLLGTAGAWAQSTNPTPGVRSRVVLARNPAVVDGFKIDAAKTRSLLATGIEALTGQKGEIAAWKEFVSSNDVVGIKINTLAPQHATHHEVVDAIAGALRSAGVAPTNILVWDRDPRKMRAAGYLEAPSTGWREVSVIGETGWDAGAFYEAKLVGRLIWGDLQFGQTEELDTRSHLPKLVTRTITKLINVPVLQDHDACGLAGCLYNLSLGTIDNSRRFEQFGQHGDPVIADACALPAVRRVLTLNIVDALIGGFAGGPQFKPQYSWPYGGLYLSRDPVAADALCLELLEAQRRAANIPPIAGTASHIATAARLDLGQSARDRIELIEATP